MQRALAALSLARPAAAAATQVRTILRAAGPTLRLNDDQLRLAERNAKRARKANAVDDDDDNPVGGRFYQPVGRADAADRECAPIPNLDPVGRMRFGMEHMANIIEQRRREIPGYARGSDVADPIAAAAAVHEDDAVRCDRAWAALVDDHARLIEDAHRARLIYTREQLTSNQQIGNGHCDGDTRLAAIRKTLNGLGLQRSEFQKLFHDDFIQACLPIIYGIPLTSQKQ